MSKPEPDHRCCVAALSSRLAFNIMLDERAIDALAEVAALLRERNDPGLAEVEHAIRTHRVGILRQRAVLGAAGLDV